MPFCTQCGNWFEEVGFTNMAKCQACLASNVHPPLSTVPPVVASKIQDAAPVQSQPVAGYESSGDFDPYYTWLGIPPAQQPPNHYQLLGIMDFEQNPDVISNAADRQTTHLRSFALGPNSAFSQRLLNEVTSARICLLNSTKKATYDQSLRLSESPVQESQTPVPPPGALNAPPAPLELPAPSAVPVTHEAPPMMLPVGANSSQAEATTSPSAPYIPKRRRSSQRATAQNRSVRQAISIVVGGLIGCLIGWFIIFVYIPKLEERKTHAQQSRSRSSAPARQAPRTIAPPQPRVPHPPPMTRPGGGSVSESELKQPSRSPFEIEPSPPSKIAPHESMPPPAPAVGPSSGNDSSSQPSTPNAISQTAVPKFVSLSEVPTSLSNPIASFSQGHEEISLRLLDGAATVTGDRLVTEETSESETRIWTVSIAPGENSGSSPPKAIGEFLLAGGELKFKWFSSAGPRERALIENCALDLSVGPVQHTIAMREPQFVESLNFDMDDPHERHDFTIANRPVADRLVLELGDLTSLPAKAHYKNDKTEVTAGNTAVIEFEELHGAELEVRFYATLDSDKVGIVVSPIFRENAASRVAMTKSQLEKTMVSVQRTIPDVQSEIQQRSNEAARLSGLSTSGMNGAQVAGLRGQINKLQQQIKSYQGRLAQLQANLAAGPRIRDFIDSLHDKVYLNFKVKSFADEQTQITLIASEGTADSI